MSFQFPNGLTHEQFLSEYWQKKPLLARGAFADFTGVLRKEEMLALSCKADVESRLVFREAEQWHVEYGPFTRTRLKRLGKKPWTVLVQGLNLWNAEADALLRQFDFIPQTRLDDLMVSYATDNGGVGPHYDNYDVFLIQGIGQRRWRIGDRQDETLVENIPLKILRNFTPVHDWVLNPGDLLYLPPHWAHDGIAVGECMTYSVGFRSFSRQEIVSEFLNYLQDSLCVEGHYADPDLKRQNNSAEISDDLLRSFAATLEAIRWTSDDIRDFAGQMLSAPKPQIFFDPPQHPLPKKTFDRAVEQNGFALNPRTILLYHGNHFFLNGEKLSAHTTDITDMLIQLAHQRILKAKVIVSKNHIQLLQLLYDWYLDGFGHPINGEK